MLFISDNEMVDVDWRRFIFCLLSGVLMLWGLKLTSLKGEEFFRIIFCYLYRILMLIGEMTRWSARC